MNWPPLHPDSSKAIAEVIQDALRTKPKDLLEFVSGKLQERSRIDPVAFEQTFLESKRKPRTYVLEDQCPLGVDPFAWVPMRYNDETILSMLTQRAGEIAADIVSTEAIDDTSFFLQRAITAYPELSYLRDSPQEKHAFQTFRAIYLACTGCSGVLEAGLDDADATLSFEPCKRLVQCARESFFEAGFIQSEGMLEAVMTCCLLRILGGHDGFQKRYGGGLTTPDSVIAYAIENEAGSLPSFQRLSEDYKALVVASLEVYFPLKTLVTTEAVAFYFSRVKEQLLPLPSGVPFCLSVMAAEHLVQSRTTSFTDEDIDLLRLGTQCLAAVEKLSAPRAYEMLLKKRAERFAMRLVRDDFTMRAIIRLSCFAGAEDKDSWNAMSIAVDSLDEHQKEIMKAELGRKDGISESPVFVLSGSREFLGSAKANPQVSNKSMVVMLARLLEDAAKTFDQLLNHKAVELRLGSLAALAKGYRSAGVPFEDTPYTLEEVGPGQVTVRVAGYS